MRASSGKVVLMLSGTGEKKERNKISLLEVMAQDSSHICLRHIFWVVQQMSNYKFDIVLYYIAYKCLEEVTNPLWRKTSLF